MRQVLVVVVDEIKHPRGQLLCAAEGCSPQLDLARYGEHRLSEGIGGNNDRTSAEAVHSGVVAKGDIRSVCVDVHQAGCGHQQPARRSRQWAEERGDRIVGYRPLLWQAESTPLDGPFLRALKCAALTADLNPARVG